MYRLLGASNEALEQALRYSNMLFIGASNEFGQFESGITAQFMGTVPAVIAGGVGTLLIVALWSWLFPALRRVDQLTQESLSIAAEQDLTETQ